MNHARDISDQKWIIASPYKETQIPFEATDGCVTIYSTCSTSNLKIRLFTIVENYLRCDYTMH